MKSRWLTEFLTVAFLLVLPGINYAQIAGGVCDPDADEGRAAQIDSFSGGLRVYGLDGFEARAGKGTVLAPGTTIETEPGASAQLTIEDGTADRTSILRIDPGSRVSITGGLYCSDLRPKADAGRWNTREIIFELERGKINVDLAREVSPAFGLEVLTPNAAARLIRSSEEKMNTTVRVAGLDDRAKVSLLEHPKVREHVTAFLMGRDIEELNPSEKKGIMAHAAMTAIGLGLIDIQAMGIMENPEIKPMVNMITQGRDLSELDENSKESALHMAGTMAVQQGLLDPENLTVYDQPDEHSLIEVKSGTMRVHNRHRGWDRGETVDVEAGMYAEVKGYAVPTPPETVRD